MKNHTNAAIALLGIAALAPHADAQKVLSYLPIGGTSRYTEECVPSPACGAAGVREYHAFPAPSRPATSVHNGAICIDDRSHVIYATNGLGIITRTRYPHLGCGGSGGTLPSLPIPTAVGNVTGMAVDPVSKELFLTNGTTIFHVDPMAGMVVLGSWTASPLNLLTGLDYDLDAPATLFAVSSAGEVAEYGVGGGLISVTPASYTWPGADAVGIARDRTDAASCHAFVLHRNGELYDHSAGLLVRSRIANRVGLSFVPSPLRLPSGGSCSGAVPVPTVSEFPIAGSTTFRFELCNIPPGTTFGMLLIGFPALSAPAATLLGGGLWTRSPMVLGVPIAGATSVAVPVSLAPLSVPAGFDAQWALRCPAAPAGYFLTDALQIELAR